MQSPLNRQMVCLPMAGFVRIDGSVRAYQARIEREVSLEHYCEHCGKGVTLRRASTAETVTCQCTKDCKAHIGRKCGWVWKGAGFRNRAERRAAT